jgi:hypothetical protein
MRGLRSPRVYAWGEVTITAYTLFGILFFVMGIVALIHPNLELPGKKDEVTIANQKVLIETHRVISIPRAASATEVALGIGLIFFGSRKPR